MLRQPSHGTRTSVLGVPTMADLDLRLSRIEQSIAALGHYIETLTAPECDCPDCGNKTYDATGWGD